MKKHFVTAFVAASTILAATSQSAFARSPSHTATPSHSVRPAHAARAAHAVRVTHGARTTHVVHAAAYHPLAAPVDATAWIGETGKASYYGPAYHGRRSASGLRFDQMALTAAHPWLPFGTKVRVILAGTDRSVIVTITDRLHSPHRVVDLSVAAARELGIIRRGVAQVSLQPV